MAPRVLRISHRHHLRSRLVRSVRAGLPRVSKPGRPARLAIRNAAAFCRLPRRLPRRPLPPLPGPTPPPPPPPTTPSSPRWASRAGRGRSRRQAGAACPARRGQRRRRVGARFRCARLPAETARGASRHRAGAGVVHSEPVRRARIGELRAPAPRGLLGSAVLHGLPFSTSC